MLNIKQIEKVISEIPFVKKILYIKRENLSIKGKVEIKFEELENPLSFEFKIHPSYPLKSYESESIRFINKDLLEYPHVMEDGSICIYTSYCTDIRKKLIIDFTALKKWIERYYINKNKDMKYEHIIVNPSPIDNHYYSFIFTEVNYNFKKNDFGEIKVSFISESLYKESKIKNYIVQSFTTPNNQIVECSWNTSYKNLPSTKGFYIFIESEPAKYNKFIFKNMLEFKNLLPEDFLKMLLTFKKDSSKTRNEVIPILIGYKTLPTEIHWQTAMSKIKQLPVKKDYKKNNSKLIHVPTIKPQRISWAKTTNASYKYFFGRGTLNSNITGAKILVIGIGAIGSIVAKTLVKGGCKFVDIADYDIKEPENVCRSEYLFNTGITDKVFEMKQILIANSPFVKINIFPKEYFEEIIKLLFTDRRSREHFSSELNKYDIIFDCTTDNDLMYVLNSLDLKCDLINLSITNHAQELVCAFYPNIYHFVNTQFSEILQNDLHDLYEPTGCWSPTFKASYNDISVLVQMAIKQINLIYEKKLPKNNFVIKTTNKEIFKAWIENF